MADDEVSLGIDIGTGSTKAGVVDADGRLLAVARATHPIDEPRPGRSETDPERWFESVAQAVRQVTAELPNHRVVAIGFTGQMHGIVVCDDQMVPLRPAVLWSDQRAEPHLARLNVELGEAFAAETRDHLGNPVVAGMAGPSLAALHHDEPELMAEVGAVMQPKDWVRYRLTGQRSTDPSDASATLLWDIGRDRWSAEALSVFGLERPWLPEVRSSSDICGGLSTDGAAAIGLPVGLPVAVGAADTAAALIGAAVAVGETQVSTGTGGQIAQLTDRPKLDGTGRTHLFRAAGLGAGHASQWYAMAAMQNVGLAIDWAMTLLGASEEEAARALAGPPLSQADSTAESSVTFSPHLTGERTPHMDASLTGAWSGLRPTTSRAALIRSVYKGVATAMADGKDALIEAGYTVDQALLAGGGSLAPWWRQLLADTMDLPLVPHDAADASVRGAGLLAWSSIGNHIDPGAAVNRTEAVRPAAT